MKLKKGELTKMSGTTLSTLYRYEKEGLVAPTYRTSGNCGLYDDNIIDRLYFIRFCRQYGINYPDIKKLLDFMDNPLEGIRPSEKLLEELIKTCSNEVFLLERHLKELQAVKKAGQCASRQSCEKIKNESFSICNECDDFKE